MVRPKYCLQMEEVCDDLFTDIAVHLNGTNCYRLSCMSKRYNRLVYEVQHLSVRKSVKLNRFVRLKSLYSFVQIPLDISHLTNLVTLGLDNYFISDISSLTGLTCLGLGYPSSVVDISMLTNLRKLSLHNPYGVKDISMLTNLTELDISGNRMISDLSNLINLTKLNISGCRYFRLRKGKLIKLNGNIEEIVELPNLKSDS